MTTVKPPSSDAAYAEWLAKLAELAVQNSAGLPLSTLQLANLDAMSRLFSTVLADSVRSKEQWKQDVEDKNSIRKEVEAHCQRYLQQILADPSVPDSVKAELGLAKLVAEKKPARRRAPQVSTSHAYA